jgi:molybdenum cofactor guanylyltransferase
MRSFDFAQITLSRVDLVAGIFVGGASSRMGGRAKGFLPAPEGGSLLDRWRALFREMSIPCVLVGKRPEYAAVELVSIEDDPENVGPIGGLAAFLAYAGDRRAIAVACDMPYVDRADLEALIACEVDVACARTDGWEPFCAIYDAPRVLPIVRAQIEAGERSLRALLAKTKTRAVAIDGAHLRDWDRPEDVGR